MSDLASHAAAVSAGYTRVDIDRGASFSPRYLARYERPTIGVSGQGGGLTSAQGAGSDTQATAQANALAALNNLRGHRYGFGSNTNSGHTRDLS